MADLCDYASRPLAFVFRYVRLRPLSHAVILAAVLAAVACSVGTQYGVKFLVDVLSNHSAAAVWTAFLVLGSLIAADNLLVAGRELDRELRLRRRHRRPAARSVPPSDRPFAGLFRRPPARHADQPRHRDLECGLHRREHVHVERAAAVRRDGRGDRAGAHRQPADGARPCGYRRHHGLPDVPPRRRRPAAASRFRRQGRRGRRRNGRRRRQHAAGARVLRLRPRASPLRRHRRPRNGRAAPQPALSREAAHLPRRGHHRADARPARLGDRAVAARRGDDRRRRAGLHARLCRCCMRRATSRWRWSTSPSTSRGCRRRWRRCWCRTSCAIIRRRSRWCGAAPASSSSTSISATATASGFSTIST